MPMQDSEQNSTTCWSSSSEMMLEQRRRMKLTVAINSFIRRRSQTAASLSISPTKNSSMPVYTPGPERIVSLDKSVQRSRLLCDFDDGRSRDAKKFLILDPRAKENAGNTSPEVADKFRSQVDSVSRSTQRQLDRQRPVGAFGGSTRLGKPAEGTVHAAVQTEGGFAKAALREEALMRELDQVRNALGSAQAKTAGLEKELTEAHVLLQGANQALATQRAREGTLQDQIDSLAQVSSTVQQVLKDVISQRDQYIKKLSQQLDLLQSTMSAETFKENSDSARAKLGDVSTHGIYLQDRLKRLEEAFMEAEAQKRFAEESLAQVQQQNVLLKSMKAPGVHSELQTEYIPQDIRFMHDVDRYASLSSQSVQSMPHMDLTQSVYSKSDMESGAPSMYRSAQSKSDLESVGPSVSERGQAPSQSPGTGEIWFSSSSHGSLLLKVSAAAASSAVFSHKQRLLLSQILRCWKLQVLSTEKSILAKELEAACSTIANLWAELGAQANNSGGLGSKVHRPAELYSDAQVQCDVTSSPPQSNTTIEALQNETEEDVSKPSSLPGESEVAHLSCDIAGGDDRDVVAVWELLQRQISVKDREWKSILDEVKAKHRELLTERDDQLQKFRLREGQLEVIISRLSQLWLGESIGDLFREWRRLREDKHLRRQTQTDRTLKMLRVQGRQQTIRTYFRSWVGFCSEFYETQLKNLRARDRLLMRRALLEMYRSAMKCFDRPSSVEVEIQNACDSSESEIVPPCSASECKANAEEQRKTIDELQQELTYERGVLSRLRGELSSVVTSDNFGLQLLQEEHCRLQIEISELRAKLAYCESDSKTAHSHLANSCLVAEGLGEILAESELELLAEKDLLSSHQEEVWALQSEIECLAADNETLQRMLAEVTEALHQERHVGANVTEQLNLVGLGEEKLITLCEGLQCEIQLQGFEYQHMYKTADNEHRNEIIQLQAELKSTKEREGRLKVRVGVLTSDLNFCDNERYFLAWRLIFEAGSMKRRRVILALSHVQICEKRVVFQAWRRLCELLRLISMKDWKFERALKRRVLLEMYRLVLRGAESRAVSAETRVQELEHHKSEVKSSFDDSFMVAEGLKERLAETELELAAERDLFLSQRAEFQNLQLVFDEEMKRVLEKNASLDSENTELHRRMEVLEDSLMREIDKGAYMLEQESVSGAGEEKLAELCHGLQRQINLQALAYEQRLESLEHENMQQIILMKSELEAARDREGRLMMQAGRVMLVHRGRESCFRVLWGWRKFVAGCRIRDRQMVLAVGRVAISEKRAVLRVWHSFCEIVRRVQYYSVENEQILMRRVLFEMYRCILASTQKHLASWIEKRRSSARLFSSASNQSGDAEPVANLLSTVQKCKLQRAFFNWNIAAKNECFFSLQTSRILVSHLRSVLFRHTIFWKRLCVDLPKTLDRFAYIRMKRLFQSVVRSWKSLYEIEWKLRRSGMRLIISVDRRRMREAMLRWNESFVGVLVRQAQESSNVEQQRWESERTELENINSSLNLEVNMLQQTNELLSFEIAGLQRRAVDLEDALQMEMDVGRKMSEEACLAGLGEEKLSTLCKGLQSQIQLQLLENQHRFEIADIEHRKQELAMGAELECSRKHESRLVAQMVRILIAQRGNTLMNCFEEWRRTKCEESILRRNFCRLQESSRKNVQKNVLLVWKQKIVALKKRLIMSLRLRLAALSDSRVAKTYSQVFSVWLWNVHDSMVMKRRFALAIDRIHACRRKFVLRRWMFLCELERRVKQQQGITQRRCMHRVLFQLYQCAVSSTHATSAQDKPTDALGRVTETERELSDLQSKLEESCSVTESLKAELTENAQQLSLGQEQILKLGAELELAQSSLQAPSFEWGSEKGRLETELANMITELKHVQTGVESQALQWRREKDTLESEILELKRRAEALGAALNGEIDSGTEMLDLCYQPVIGDKNLFSLCEELQQQLQMQRFELEQRLAIAEQEYAKRVVDISAQLAGAKEREGQSMVDANAARSFLRQRDIQHFFVGWNSVLEAKKMILRKASIVENRAGKRKVCATFWGWKEHSKVLQDMEFQANLALQRRALYGFFDSVHCSSQEQADGGMQNGDKQVPYSDPERLQVADAIILILSETEVLEGKLLHLQNLLQDQANVTHNLRRKIDEFEAERVAHMVGVQDKDRRYSDLLARLKFLEVEYNILDTSMERADKHDESEKFLGIVSAPEGWHVFESGVHEDDEIESAGDVSVSGIEYQELVEVRDKSDLATSVEEDVQYVGSNRSDTASQSQEVLEVRDESLAVEDQSLGRSTVPRGSDGTDMEHYRQAVVEVRNEDGCAEFSVAGSSLGYDGSQIESRRANIVEDRSDGAAAGSISLLGNRNTEMDFQGAKIRDVRKDDELTQSEDSESVAHESTILVDYQVLVLRLRELEGVLSSKETELVNIHEHLEMILNRENVLVHANRLLQDKLDDQSVQLKEVLDQDAGPNLEALKSRLQELEGALSEKETELASVHEQLKRFFNRENALAEVNRSLQEKLDEQSAQMLEMFDQENAALPEKLDLQRAMWQDKLEQECSALQGKIDSVTLQNRAQGDKIESFKTVVGKLREYTVRLRVRVHISRVLNAWYRLFESRQVPLRMAERKNMEIRRKQAKHALRWWQRVCVAWRRIVKSRETWWTRGQLLNRFRVWVRYVASVDSKKLVVSLLSAHNRCHIFTSCLRAWSELSNLSRQGMFGRSDRERRLKHRVLFNMFRLSLSRANVSMSTQGTIDGDILTETTTTNEGCDTSVEEGSVTISKDMQQRHMNELNRHRARCAEAESELSLERGRYLEVESELKRQHVRYSGAENELRCQRDRCIEAESELKHQRDRCMEAESELHRERNRANMQHAELVSLIAERQADEKVWQEERAKLCRENDILASEPDELRIELQGCHERIDELVLALTEQGKHVGVAREHLEMLQENEDSLVASHEHLVTCFQARSHRLVVYAFKRHASLCVQRHLYTWQMSCKMSAKSYSAAVFGVYVMLRHRNCNLARSMLLLWCRHHHLQRRSLHLRARFIRQTGQSFIRAWLVAINMKIALKRTRRVVHGRTQRLLLSTAFRLWCLHAETGRAQRCTLIASWDIQASRRQHFLDRLVHLVQRRNQQLASRTMFEWSVVTAAHRRLKTIALGKGSRLWWRVSQTIMLSSFQALALLTFARLHSNRVLLSKVLRTFSGYLFVRKSRALSRSKGGTPQNRRKVEGSFLFLHRPDIQSAPYGTEVVHRPEAIVKDRSNRTPHSLNVMRNSLLTWKWVVAEARRRARCQVLSTALIQRYSRRVLSLNFAVWSIRTRARLITAHAAASSKRRAHNKSLTIMDAEGDADRAPEANLSVILRGHRQESETYLQSPLSDDDWDNLHLLGGHVLRDISEWQEHKHDFQEKLSSKISNMKS